MSESGSLQNTAFIGGGGFHWWIGQIADDSTWRDNIIPGKFTEASQVKGWGYRYKVRIIGYHDQNPQNSIPDDQLPWAQVMYPITGGGGQASASQTPNLRQGMFVFGFFMDGSEAQVPVIMGVLGNNAQTQLQQTTGQQGFVPTSGYARGATPDPNIRPSDSDLKATRPTPPGTSPSEARPGVTLDRYGRDPSRPPTAREFAAARAAREEADRQGLTGEARERLVAEATLQATAEDQRQAQNPTITPQNSGQPTLENNTAIHQTTNSDVVRLDMYLKKTPLSSPCKKQNSDLKNIQVIIENLTNDINKLQQARDSYIDAVSSKLGSCDSLISMASTQISKFLKSIFDQVRGYVLKEFNRTTSNQIDTVQPNQRYKLMELKEKSTDLLSKVFNQIIGKLESLVGSALNNLLGNVCSSTNPQSERRIAPEGFAPNTPICSVESLTGNVLGLVINDMMTGIDRALLPISNVTSQYTEYFNALGAGVGRGAGGVAIEGIAGNVANAGISAATDRLNLTNISTTGLGLGATIDPILSSASNATSAANGIIDQFLGSLTVALGFINQVVSFFSTDEKPKCPVNDSHTLQNGGGATETPNEPSAQSVNNAAQSPAQIQPAQRVPFAVPPTSLTNNVGTLSANGRPENTSSGATQTQVPVTRTSNPNPARNQNDNASNALELY